MRLIIIFDNNDVHKFISWKGSIFFHSKFRKRIGNLQYNLKKKENSYNPEKSSELTSNVIFSVRECQNEWKERKLTFFQL